MAVSRSQSKTLSCNSSWYLPVSRRVRKRDSAVGMGLAIVVITLASLTSWALYYLLLKPLGMQYMSTLVYILVIASWFRLSKCFEEDDSRPIPS